MLSHKDGLLCKVTFILKSVFLMYKVYWPSVSHSAPLYEQIYVPLVSAQQARHSAIIRSDCGSVGGPHYRFEATFRDIDTVASEAA